MDVGVAVLSQDHLVFDVALSGSNGCWGQSCGDAVPVDSQLRTLLILILKGHVVIKANTLSLSLCDKI